MRFSEAQTKAIDTHGSSLLVSAAAGSGKTAVLVERVIRKILAGGEIKRLWIMTFSEAAASEMALKIEQAVKLRLEMDEDNEHLARQVMGLSSANISTIHAMCKRLIEQNFQQIGLDPSVSVGNEDEMKVLFSEILEEFVEDMYNRAEQDERLKDFLRFFGTGKTEEGLFSVLNQAYDHYKKQPFPQATFRDQVDIFASFSDDYLYKMIVDKLEEAAAQYDLILNAPEAEILMKSKMWQNMAVEQEATQLTLKMIKERQFDEAGAYLGGFRIPGASNPGKVAELYPEYVELSKMRRAYAKGLLEELQQVVFCKTEQQHLSDIARTNQILEILFEQIALLDARFTEVKRQKSVITFDDFERFAIEILIENYDSETDVITPSSVALELRETIDEIIVDEYQDTNRRQDMIFRALSRDEQNIFMVGDVKQSIYRFRGACPELFLQKKQNSEQAMDTEIHSPSFLYLNQNFRSHPDILDFANLVFRNAMSTNLGQIEYDESEQLYAGGVYAEDSKGYVELDVIVASDEVQEDALSLIEQEAELTADKITSLVGTPFYDVKKGQERPLRLSDIAIMFRTAKGVVGHFERALERRGIRCINNNQDQKLLDFWEIKMLRAYLQVLNNPYRDIPLITLLYSDFYCFDATALADIRVRDKYVPFYDALKLAAETDVRCNAFLQDIETLRQDSLGARTDEIIQMIFARTHILERVAAYSDGKTRVENLQLFYRFAAAFERETYRGLFAFLHHLDQLDAMDNDLYGACGTDAPENCVNLLSVHKSKGLEYPVCFLVNLGRGEGGRKAASLLHNDLLGQTVQMQQDDRFVRYPTLPYNIIAEENHREALSEEMRNFYVALTRPKTHLYLVCAKRKKQLKTLLESVSSYRGSKPAEFLSASSSTLKWLLYALREQEGLGPLYEALGFVPQGHCFDARFVTEVYGDVTEDSVPHFFAPKETVDIEPVLQLAQKTYLYEPQTRLPVKLSVSEVKGLREKDPEATDLIPFYFGKKQPSFLSGRVTGNVVGNAVHKFMQFADFSALANGGFESEKQRLIQNAFLTEKELNMVAEEQVRNFVSAPLFQEMISADFLEKEKRFFFSVPADELYADCTTKDPILLQGVLDCYYEKDGKLYIVDYKTDQLKNADLFRQRYGVQLQLYRYAVYQLTGKKAEKLYLYSFYLNEVIEIS